MPTRAELIATDRTVEEIAKEISADGVVFQDLADLVAVVRNLNPKIDGFDTSCFNGEYLTGDVDEAYLERLASGKISVELLNKVKPSLVDHSVRIDDDLDDDE